MEVPFQYGRLAEAKSFIDRVEDRKELKNFPGITGSVLLITYQGKQ